MNSSSALVILLESVLGKGKQTSNGNYAFRCPNGCHEKKLKLEINLETQQYQCWICSSRKDGFRGKKISTLLKKLKASANKINEAKLLTNDLSKQEILDIGSIVLPKEFISLSQFMTKKYDNILSKHALNYLKNRDVSSDDILKYNIGFCPYGQYGKRIIVPSYDKDGILNYFIARSFDDNFIKYKNPPQGVKDIIGFELYINWSAPIIIVEGIFDALRIKRNVIPLFGKVIHQKLMTKLVKSDVDRIYIALDKDAIKDSIRCCEKLLEYNKEVYLVEIQSKDFSEMSKDKILELLEDTDPLNFQRLIELKLGL